MFLAPNENLFTIELEDADRKPRKQMYELVHTAKVLLKAWFWHDSFQINYSINHQIEVYCFTKVRVEFFGIVKPRDLKDSE